MPDRRTFLEGLTVVVVGSFNPAIFHPSWLSANGLIREEEASEAKIELVSPDASIFTTDWMIFQVIQPKMSLHLTDPTKLSPLRDLARGIFQVLEHTPVEAFGLNRELHFQMESEEAWHELGHYLAPKGPWEDVFQKPGLRTLLMEGRRGENGNDLVRVRVEPSTKTASAGLYVNVHQHYQVRREGATRPTALAFCGMLEKAWQDFLAFSDGVPRTLFKRFDEVPR